MFHQPKVIIKKPKALERIEYELQISSYQSLEELMENLSKIPCNQTNWQMFFKNITDELLFMLFLNMSIKKIEEIICYNYNPANVNISQILFDKAKDKLNEVIYKNSIIPAYSETYFFTLSEMYERIRSREGEYNSFCGYVSGLLYEDNSKSKKIKNVSLLKEFICSSYKLNEFDEFLKSKNMFHLKSSILEEGRGSRIEAIYLKMHNHGNDLEKQKNLFNNSAIRSS